jgi:hypothetical protein
MSEYDKDLAPCDPQPEEEITCKNACGLGDNDPERCRFHSAKDRKNPRIIGKPTYDSLDQAAKVAAKIISHYTSKENNREYGIGIYKRKDEEKYCLVETRAGEMGKANIQIDNRIGKERIINNKIYHCVNDELYSFEAHVHSHPEAYEQEFSTHDYIVSYGGEKGKLPDEPFSKNDYKPFIIYLVANYQGKDGNGNNVRKKQLIKFHPPTPRFYITNQLNSTLKRHKDENDAQPYISDYLTMSYDANNDGGYQKIIMEDIK